MLQRNLDVNWISIPLSGLGFPLIDNEQKKGTAGQSDFFMLWCMAMSDPEKPAPDGSARLIKASVQHLFESLLDQTADRVYIKDRQSRFVYVSDALAKMHGL